MSRKTTWISDSTARAIHRNLPKELAKELIFAKVKTILTLKAQLMDKMGLMKKMSMTTSDWTLELGSQLKGKKISRRLIKALLEVEEAYYATVSEGAWSR